MIATSPGFRLRPRQQLATLFRLRWLYVGLQGLAIGFCLWFLDLPLPLAPLGLILLLEAVFNILVAMRLRAGFPVTEPEVFAHLLLDTAFLTALLYFTGGAANPFVSLYLVPVVLASVSLAPVSIGLLAMAAVGGYGLVMGVHHPLPPAAPGMQPFALHVVGMGINFLISTLIITTFAVSLARSLRDQERAQARQRERDLQREQVLALGTQAAHAAHQLGTPLATLAIASEDLLERKDLPRDVHEDIRLMSGQLERCRSLLKGLAVGPSGETEGQTHFAAFLGELLAQWRSTRPDVQIDQRVSNELARVPAPQAATLGAALLNLLDNAAEASLANGKDRVLVAADLEEALYCIRIEDEGRGIPETQRELAGTLGFTTKASGAGMGLFLANASVEQLGGQVILTDRPGEGTQTRVDLPLPPGVSVK